MGFRAVPTCLTGHFPLRKRCDKVTTVLGLFGVSLRGVLRNLICFYISNSKNHHSSGQRREEFGPRCPLTRKGIVRCNSSLFRVSLRNLIRGTRPMGRRAESGPIVVKPVLILRMKNVKKEVAGPYLTLGPLSRPPVSASQLRWRYVEHTYVSRSARSELIRVPRTRHV